MQEREVFTLPGVPMVLVLLAALGLDAWWLVRSVQMFANPLLPLLIGAVLVFGCVGFFIVQPNQTAVLQFVGVERKSGLRWANPCGERGTQPVVNTGTLYNG